MVTHVVGLDDALADGGHSCCSFELPNLSPGSGFVSIGFVSDALVVRIVFTALPRPPLRGCSVTVYTPA